MNTRCAWGDERRLGAIRFFVGLFAWIYVIARVAHFGDFSRLTHFEPIGVASVLAAPLPSVATWLLAILSCVFGGAFCLGWRFSITGPVFAALLLWVTTYASSWGMILHTENLLVLHVIALALLPSADGWSLDHRAGRRATNPNTPYGFAVWGLCAITVAGYLVAGVAKLNATGLDWATSDLLRNYVAYDAIRKAALGSIHSPIGAWLGTVEWIWQPLAWMTLALELLAPLALLHRRVGRGWVLGVWGFHMGVLVTMAILFPYPLSGIAFVGFFAPERAMPWLVRKWPCKKSVEWRKQPL